MEIEVIANYACQVGENPLWHPLEKKVYWLDIPTGTIFRYDPNTGTHEIFYRGDVTGGFTFQVDGSLLLFGMRGRISRLYQGQLTPITDSIAGEEHNRFNDIIADPQGRIIAGTTPYEKGSRSGCLYRIDRDGKVTKLRDGILLSNGMGFSPDFKTFYHADSNDHTITQFEYDIDRGELGEPRLFARLSEELGVPDGLTVDADGYIWLATWDGWRLLRYDPQGNIEREIVFPVKKVSSLTFAGDDYRDMYVTSAGGDQPQENGILAGALFRVRVGIHGRSESLSDIHAHG